MLEVCCPCGEYLCIKVLANKNSLICWHNKTNFCCSLCICHPSLNYAFINISYVMQCIMRSTNPPVGTGIRDARRRRTSRAAPHRNVIQYGHKRRLDLLRKYFAKPCDKRIKLKTSQENSQKYQKQHLNTAHSVATIGGKRPVSKRQLVWRLNGRGCSVPRKSYSMNSCSF